jgi:hypothetical protein
MNKPMEQICYLLSSVWYFGLPKNFPYFMEFECSLLVLIPIDTHLIYFLTSILTFKCLEISLRTTRSKIKKILYGARFSLSFLYGFQNGQRTFLYTSLTDWFL